MNDEHYQGPSTLKVLVLTFGGMILGYFLLCFCATVFDNVTAGHHWLYGDSYRPRHAQTIRPKSGLQRYNDELMRPYTDPFGEDARRMRIQRDEDIRIEARRDAMRRGY